MSYNVITGAKALIKINDKIAGFATGISISESTFNGRVDSLGFIDTREVVPIGRAVSATVNFLRVFSNTDVSSFEQLAGTETDEGEIVNTTTDITKGISDRTKDALTKATFDLEVYDTAPGTDDGEALMYTMMNCRVSSQNFIVDRGSIAGVQVTIDGTHLVRHDTRLVIVP